MERMQRAVCVVGYADKLFYWFYFRSLPLSLSLSFFSLVTSDYFECFLYFFFHFSLSSTLRTAPKLLYRTYNNHSMRPEYRTSWRIIQAVDSAIFPLYRFSIYPKHICDTWFCCADGQHMWTINDCYRNTHATCEIEVVRYRVYVCACVIIVR